VDKSNLRRASVRAYPNPFSEKLTIQVQSAVTGTASLILYNMSGQKVLTVFEGQMEQGMKTFDIALPAAMRQRLIYIFRQNGEAVTGQLFGVR